MIKRITILVFCASMFFVLIIDACKSSKVSSLQKQHTIGLYIPKGWPKPTFDIFENNPVTEEGFQLGRKLFYDGILSRDGSTACATCHQQFAGFSSFDHNLSHGINNSLTTRNAPVLFNLAWMRELHWDGGINHIEVQPIAPITAENEMGETLENVLYKLRRDKVYVDLFSKTFGDTIINTQRVLKALAQFTGSIQSYNSKYDKVKNGEANFSASEQAGYEFFKSNCNTCHKEPLFTDNAFHNIGLPINNSLKDYGQMKITNKPEDSLKFKTPSLRNIALSQPYMHDGRFINFSKIIEHYNTLDIVNLKNIDPVLKAKKIIVTPSNRVDLIAFLHTLTDSAMTHDARFSSPINNSPVFIDKH
ncbi:cytochrome-c peroxidase [Ferruginibacter sp. SUN002]|uniref:cytochrome-c peroxidase n=1 Tax=Ferruginibacter sp. SUN002 TaxID=2937789 RepID=UPI003D36832C